MGLKSPPALMPQVPPPRRLALKVESTEVQISSGGLGQHGVAILPPNHCGDVPNEQDHQSLTTQMPPETLRTVLEPLRTGQGDWGIKSL